MKKVNWIKVYPVSYLEVIDKDCIFTYKRNMYFLFNLN